MASVPFETRVCRWNPTESRKEWVRLGYPTLIVSGGVIDPGGMVVTLSRIPVGAVSAGNTVRLTANISGGVGPFTLVWTQISGANAPFETSGNSIELTAPVTNVNLGFRVVVTDSTGARQETTTSFAVGGSTSGALQFPGHVPNRVLLGMATPAEGAGAGPGWVEARQIIGQPIYEARRFTGQWVGANAFQEMINQADQANALPNISFKVPSNNWAGVANKQYDSDLVTLFSLCKNYGKPVICGFHHEPAGDGDLATWARMQTYCTYFLAGYRNVSISTAGVVTLGTYNAAHDLSLNNGGNLGWAPTGNGFWWRNMTATNLAADRAAAWPQHLITALNNCKGIMMNDFYDSDYVDQQRAFTEQQYRVAGSGVRTWKRIDNFITWARQNGVKASGAGEYGCIDAAEMDRCWNVMWQNRDIWSIGNYFNSLANSDHEWRLIPANYPDTNYQSDKTNAAGQRFQDLGGTPQREQCLIRFRVHLTQSTAPTHTGPL